MDGRHRPARRPHPGRHRHALSDHRASAGYRAAMLEQSLLKFHWETRAEVTA